MNSFLLTWNPKKYSQQNLDASLDDYDASLEFNWNIGAHKQAKQGDFVFFYKQGSAPNGLFASGTISGPPSQSDDLDDSRWYFPIELIRKVKPWEQFLLTKEECLEFFSQQQLSAQQSGYPTKLSPERLNELLSRVGSDEKPLTVDDLRGALVAVELTDREKRALIALWQLPDSAGTSKEVAEQAGFTHFIEANGCIGTVGNKLAKFFSRLRPGEEEPGYTFIADGERQDGKFVWHLLKDICEAIEQLGWVEPLLASQFKEYEEGEISLVSLTRYERSPAAREAALKAHGYVCSACGFDFGTFYGERGRQFIEVHHLEPLNLAAYPRHTDPERDLRPVCSNCHRIIHRGEPMLSIEQIREIIGRKLPPIESN
jgi:5-methylcytosine-specific restriction protein A